MTDISENINTVVAATSPLIKSIVDVFVTPKLEALKKKNGENKLALPTEEHFTEYFHRTFKKLAVVNTLVFNNSQKFLSDIFVPLTITSKNRSAKIKVNGFPDKISDEFGNILITDTAGMGKSTLMKVIFIDIIKRGIGIPLFIELRRLNGSKKLINEIQEQLNSINENFDHELLTELLSQGGFIIILDGYDEIPLNDQSVVTTDIQDFISKVSKNRFFITSRPENALISFGNFQEFKISPLVRKEAFELLRKYDNQGQLSSLLIKKLQENSLASIQEFLTNPLLVSLLFIAFEHKQTIPFKKYLFYRQVYDANFDLHDLTKGDSYIHDKYSNLQIDDFHRVLRHLGFNCFKKQRIEFIKDELLKLIKESKEFCAGLNFKESDFLLDLLKSVPLFTQDGNYYRWSHKSLQEYFAAQFIYLDSKDKQNQILTQLYNHDNLDKFINVLDLYYDMDYKTFRNVIEKSLLLEYKKHSESSYLNSYDRGILADDVRLRKELDFLITTFIFVYIDQEGKADFDDKKLTELITKNHKRNPELEKYFQGIYISPEIAIGVNSLQYESKKNSILTLLANKKNQIVKAVNRQNTEKIELSLNLANYELLKIDDLKSNQLNSLDNFTKINSYLTHIRLSPIIIDETKALNKLEEIQKSISLEDEQNFFL